eukprot:7959861-Lingulodinium_polyedra.AAC.1
MHLPPGMCGPLPVHLQDARLLQQRLHGHAARGHAQHCREWLARGPPAGDKDFAGCLRQVHVLRHSPVSYTHLTLPTICSV